MTIDQYLMYELFKDGGDWQMFLDQGTKSITKEFEDGKITMYHLGKDRMRIDIVRKGGE